jgi:hypothetical protein
MEYANNKKILRGFYTRNGLTNVFDKDNYYLESAFNEINKIWIENLDKIKLVNFVMIAEAPLWGHNKKYIYNPLINNSQFFYRSDLGDILNRHIPDKNEFINVLNEIGLIVADISPFPLNQKDTAINYRELTTNQYRHLVSLTIPFFFEQKIKTISKKKSINCKFFFRYTRVKNTFEDLIGDVLINCGVIKTKTNIGDISKSGGGIDKTKFGEILKSNLNLS